MGYNDEENPEVVPIRSTPLVIDRKHVYIHPLDAQGFSDEQERPRLYSSLMKAIAGIFCCS